MPDTDLQPAGADVLHGKGGHRQRWEELPAPVRAGIEARLGAPVVDAASQAGGFSPGVAARVRLADGRRAFIKAISGTAYPQSVAFYRDEAAVAACLPPAVPAARLLWSTDDGDWVVLAFEAVDGHPPTLPWRTDELARIFAALTDLAAIPAPDNLPALGDRLRMDHWRELAGGDPRRSAVDPWVREHLAELADLESGWPSATAGDALVHCDMRADNVLLTADRVVFVDWPGAVRGAPWFDLLGMLPSVGMQGGGDPAQLFAAHPLGAAADPTAVTTALAALTGYFIGQSLLPPPPGLPRVRQFQAAQGHVTLPWLQRRLAADPH